MKTLITLLALTFTLTAHAEMPVKNAEYAATAKQAAKLIYDLNWGPSEPRQFEVIKEKLGQDDAHDWADYKVQVFSYYGEDKEDRGIDLKIQLWDATVAWGKLATQEFDAFYMAYPYVTATEALNLYFASRQVPTPNRMNWKDPKTDELLKAAATAVDAGKRKEAIGAVQTQLTEANVWVPLASQPLWVVAGDRVEGVRAHGIYGAGLYKGLDLKLKR